MYQTLQSGWVEEDFPYTAMGNPQALLIYITLHTSMLALPKHCQSFNIFIIFKYKYL